MVIERADPLAANWFESSSRWWLLEAGLPRPELQVPFAAGAGLVWVEVVRWVPAEMRTPAGRDEVARRFWRASARRRRSA